MITTKVMATRTESVKKIFLHEIYVGYFVGYSSEETNMETWIVECKMIRKRFGISKRLFIII